MSCADTFKPKSHNELMDALKSTTDEVLYNTLQLACRNDNYGMLIFLLRNKCYKFFHDTDKVNALIRCSTGRRRIVEGLLDYGAERFTKQIVGANLEYASIVNSALSRYKSNFCILDSSLDSFLYYCAERDYAQTIRVLVQHGADVNYSNAEALREAVRMGNFTSAKVLLELGADVSSVDNEAIRIACSYGYIDLVELLISHGADVNCRNGACLDSAITNKVSGTYNYRLIFMLIDNGARPKDSYPEFYREYARTLYTFNTP